MIEMDRIDCLTPLCALRACGDITLYTQSDLPRTWAKSLLIEELQNMRVGAEVHGGVP